MDTSNKNLDIETYASNKANGKMDVIILDDFLEIQSYKDGYKQLEDDEYEIAYVEIPRNEKFTNANGMPFAKGKYTADIYTYKDSYNEEDRVFFKSVTIDGMLHKEKLPKGTNHVAIEIKGLDESLYVEELYVYVKVHLDKNKEIPDTGNIRNLAGLVVNHTDKRANVVGEENYLGLDSERWRVIDRDLEKYGDYIQRWEYDYEYEADKVFHALDMQLTGFNVDDANGYTNNIFLTSYMTDTTNIEKISVYSVLPEGLKIDESKLNSTIYDQNTIWGLFRQDGTRITDLRDLYDGELEINIIDNYKGSNRTFVEAIYDFSNSPVDTSGDGNPSHISLKLPLKLSYNDLDEYGESYVIKGEQFLESEGKIILAYDSMSQLGLDDGTALNDGDIWIDINDNGDTKEELVFNEVTGYVTQIKDTYIEMKEFVKAPRTYNRYTTNLIEGNALENDRKDIWASFGCDYSYKLNIYNTGRPVSNLIIWDILEQGSYETNKQREVIKSQWQGEFKEVDISYAKGLGLNPIVYYSDKANPTKDLNSGDWSEVKPSNIKAIAVEFEGKMLTSKEVYVEVKMKAPVYREELVGLYTVNEYDITYESLNNTKLNSNAVYLRIDKPKGMISLTKIDGDTEKELTGYKFVLSQDGKDVYYITEDGTYTMDNKITDEVYTGKYLLTEEKPPKGYKAITPKEIELTKEMVETNGLLELRIANTKNLGTVKIVKTDVQDESLLEGAVFDLYDYKTKEIVIDSNGNKLQNLTTNADGEIVVTGLKWGSYYFVETKAPKDHYLTESNRTPFDVTVDNVDEPIILDISNRHLGKVTLKKLDEDNKDIRVANAKYELYNSKNDSLGIYETDDNGEFTVENLEWGSYYFIELSAPNGYDINEERIDFDILAHNSVTGQKITTYDSERLSSILLTKYDEVNNEPLEDAWYTLEKLNGDKWYTIGSYRTNSIGNLSISDLKFGTYRFTEIKAPQGYKIDAKPIEFDINVNTTDKTMYLTHTNERLLGSLEVQKVDDASNSLSGVKFELYNQNGTRIRENEEFITSASGLLKISNLDWGDYYLKEVEAPKGYKLDKDKKYEFTIDAESIADSRKLEIVNIRQTGSVKLIKKNESELRLSNAKYGLYSTNGDLIEEKVTDNNGEALFENITWGSYYFQEIIAPNGYTLSDEKIQFVVNKDNCGIVQEIEATDKKDLAYIVITKKLEKTEDVYNAFDNPSFMFKIEGRDFEGNHHTWYRQISLSKDKLDGSSIMADIPKSDDNGYTITELNTTRYKLVGKTIITGDDSEFSWDNLDIVDDKDSTLVAIVKSLDTEWVEEEEPIEIPGDSFEIGGESGDEEFEVTPGEIEGPIEGEDWPIEDWPVEEVEEVGNAHAYYLNTLNNWNKYSATSNAVNMVKKARKLVYLNAIYTQDRDITSLFDKNTGVLDTNLLRDNLIVTAYYDMEDSNNEISKVLQINDYEISPKELEGTGTKQDYIIIVKYTENGVTRQTTVTLEANVESKNYRIEYSNESSTYTNRYESGEVVTIEEPRFSSDEIEEGYGFVYWEDLDSEGVTYKIGDKLTNSENKALIRLRAVYLPIEYSITYENVADISGFRTTYTVKSDSYTLPTPVKEGYKFIGWDVNGIVESSVTIESGSIGNRIYKAVWEESDRTVTIASGKQFREALISAAGNNADNIKSIKFTQDAIPSGATVIDIPKSNVTNCSLKAYTARFNKNTVYLWTDADVVFLGEDSINLCRELKNLTDISGLAYLNASKATKINNIFYMCTSLVDVSPIKNWDISNATDMGSLFQGCSSIVDLSMLNWDTSNVTIMDFTFNGCTKLERLPSLNISSLNRMVETFSTDKALKEAEFNGVGHITNMYQAFIGCTNLSKARIINDPNTKFQVYEVSGSERQPLYKIFASCTGLIEVEGLDTWNIEGVTSLNGIFSDCYSIMNLADIANWNTKDVTDMSDLFKDCKLLVNVAFSNSWNTSNVTDFSRMFYGDLILQELDLTSFSTSKARDMSEMFRYSKALLHIYADRNKWNTSNVLYDKKLNMFDLCGVGDVTYR